jgi:RNA polymerase sigma factor (sigma-70 family)
MENGQTKAPLLHLQRALQSGAGLTDGELLERFLGGRDDQAFAALLRRYGGMVLGVCRRVLRQEQDAEDAFQATFLVLARKGATLTRRELVGHWLYGVALRTALVARARSARRRASERPLADLPEPEAPRGRSEADLAALLQEEVQRLPAKYRLPVVLCELDGGSRREVARQLGIPEGTLSSRLAAARKLLASRLARRGAALAAALAAAQAGAPACVPAPLLVSTLAAVDPTPSESVLPARVAALTGEVVNAMFWAKVKLFLTVLIAAGVLAAGAVWFSGSVAADPGAQAAKADPPGAPGPPAKADKQPAEGKTPARGKTVPPGVPLQLTVKVKKGKYKLDLGGLSAKDFRKLVESRAKAPAGQAAPPPPAVDLELELKNTSDQKLQLFTSGDLVQVWLDLKGPDVLAGPSGGAMTMELRPGKAEALAPGKSVSFHVTRLSYGLRGLSHRAYWLAPGEYTLTASVRTAVFPPPEGSAKSEMGFGAVTITAPPVTLQVVP